MLRLVVKLVLLALYCHCCLVSALKCVDSRKGVCDTGRGLFDACYYHIENGTYNCDEGKFCASKLKKKGGGCFPTTDGSGTHCCCNTADMCAYKFDETFMGNKTQKCLRDFTSANGEIKYKPCEETWCMAYLFRGSEGASSSGVYRSCQGRFKYDAQRFVGVTNLTWSPVLNSVATPDYLCDKIADPNVDGTTRGCVDVDTKVGKTRYTGKYCCCKNMDECNKKITWLNETSRIIESPNGGGRIDHMTIHSILTLALLAAASRLFPSLP